jgi:hypothetical protein
MDRETQKDGQAPSDDPKIAERGEKNREEIDKVPEPGTDPLHEGP